MKIEAGKYYRTRDGRKVGPMSDDWGVVSCGYRALRSDGNLWRESDGKNYPNCAGRSDNSDLDLIEEWQDGPVRTVMRKEIVNGRYGSVKVCAHTDTTATIQIGGTKLNPTELRAAAATLIEIADALEDQ